MITEEINCEINFQHAEWLEAHRLALEETIKVQEPHIDSDDEGKVRTSAYLTYSPFFILFFFFVYFTIILYMQILSLTEAREEEDFEPYIPEEREAEAAHNRKMAQCIQMMILQDLRQELGAVATLPENATKDLILQVIIVITLNSSPLLVIDSPPYIIYTLKLP